MKKVRVRDFKLFCVCIILAREFWYDKILWWLVMVEAFSDPYNRRLLSKKRNSRKWKRPITSPCCLMINVDSGLQISLFSFIFRAVAQVNDNIFFLRWWTEILTIWEHEKLEIMKYLSTLNARKSSKFQKCF